MIMDLIMLKENYKKKKKFYFLLIKVLSISSTIQKPNVGLSEKEQVTKYLNINRFDNEPIKFYLLHLPIKCANR